MNLFLLQPSITFNYTNSICREGEGGAIFIGNDYKYFQWIQTYLSIYIFKLFDHLCSKT